jgi:hypothetical protein
MGRMVNALAIQSRAAKRRQGTISTIQYGGQSLWSFNSRQACRALNIGRLYGLFANQTAILCDFLMRLATCSTIPIAFAQIRTFTHHQRSRFAKPATVTENRQVEPCDGR